MDNLKMNENALFAFKNIHFTFSLFLQNNTEF